MKEVSIFLIGIIVGFWIEVIVLKITEHPKSKTIITENLNRSEISNDSLLSDLYRITFNGELYAVRFNNDGLNCWLYRDGRLIRPEYYRPDKRGAFKTREEAIKMANEHFIEYKRERAKWIKDHENLKGL